MEPIAHPDWERWTKRGVEACAEIYGRTYHKLMLNLRALHPAIEPLVVVDAYGKILGRPGLDSKRRELCTLAAIAMQNAPRQLHAHLRGALNTGSTRDDVDEVIAVVEDDLSKERALQQFPDELRKDRLDLATTGRHRRPRRRNDSLEIIGGADLTESKLGPIRL